VLELIDISKYYGNLMALDSVSFSVSRGTVNAVIGPYGAGKSTLLDLITGVSPPSNGKILFEGKEISAVRNISAAHLGITRSFQVPQSLKDISVLESILIRPRQGPHTAYHLPHDPRPPATVDPKALRDRARGILSLFGMEDKQDSPYLSLSYADRKKLEMARALAVKPKLILLDEPIAGLSITESWEIGDLILKLKESGTTILLVEHDMNFVIHIAEKIVALSQGRVLAKGTPEEILNDKQVIRECW
jgi:branched-chain amino acid transport system ATP-binding protein